MLVRSETTACPRAEDFATGDAVWYEVATRRGDDFRVEALVLAVGETRVLVAFDHWADGRRVRRQARPHRLTRREVR